MPWIAGIRPGVEWVRWPNPGPYATRQEAIAAIAADPDLYTPDPYGNEPHPWVAYVEEEGLHGWAPRGCTCEGLHQCPACMLAREYVTDEEIEAAEQAK